MRKIGTGRERNRERDREMCRLYLAPHKQGWTVKQTSGHIDER